LVICVDIDGVLGDLAAPVGGELLKTHGVHLPPEISWEDLRDFLAVNNIGHNWIRKLLSDEWFWAKVPPFTGNIEAVRAWIDAGHDVHILTSRPQSSMIPTRAWLAKNGVMTTKVAFYPAMKKYEYMQKVEADFIVEDLFYEAYKCSAFGFRSYVVRRPYNVAFEERIINKLCSFIDTLWDIDLNEVRDE